MYNIKYSQDAFLSLDSFINSYKDYFTRLYSDTGIDDEDLIIKNYLDVGNMLYINLKYEIENSLKDKQILGIHFDENNNKYLVVSADNIRIFIYYSQSEELKERYVEKINFYRK